MAKEAFEIMKRASIFMILAQTIIYFRPQESYEKYLRLLIHLMLIVVLFFPVVELLNHSAGDRMQSSLAAYTIQMEQLMNGMDMEILPQDDAYLSTIQEEVKIRLNNYSEQTGYVVESAKIQGYHTGKEGGADTDIKLYIRAKPDSQAISAIKVKEITWKSDTAKQEENRLPTAQEQQLKAQFAQILGMEQYNLEVFADEMD